MFVIEDELHGEDHGEFATFDDALSELERRSRIAWDERPNRAPCTNWRGCGRNYEVIEYDIVVRPWKQLRRVRVLEVDATGIRWSRES
jgi:hypothetical protein